MPQTQRSRGRKRTQRTQRTQRSSSRSSARKPDALAMLKDDHRKVSEMFDRYERTRGDDQKQRLATTICHELKIHAQLEEELFYPAVRDEIYDEEIVSEAEVEHGTAKQLIEKIESGSPSDDCYDARVKVLGEYIKHHIKEEEGEMFKAVRQSELDTEELGRRMKERKHELTGREDKSLIGAVVSAATGR